MLNSIQINQDVLQVLDRSTSDGNQLFLGSEKLDRKLYTDVNKVLVAIGGKWDRGAKAHLFNENVCDVLEPILENGEYNRVKQDYGQFDSPAAIVETVMSLAEITSDMRVLEPSAGNGNIAFAASARGAVVDAFEIDTTRHSYLYESGHLSQATLSNFLETTPQSVYDRVVMNPPFARQADIKHVMHAFKFLKGGGRLVSVMSAGVLFRENSIAKDFLRFVQDHGGKIEPLPDNSFAASGTNIRTCIVSVDRSPKGRMG